MIEDLAPVMEKISKDAHPTIKVFYIFFLLDNIIKIF